MTTTTIIILLTIIINIVAIANINGIVAARHRHTSGMSGTVVDLSSHHARKPRTTTTTSTITSFMHPNQSLVDVIIIIKGSALTHWCYQTSEHPWLLSESVRPSRSDSSFGVLHGVEFTGARRNALPVTRAACPCSCSINGGGRRRRQCSMQAAGPRLRLADLHVHVPARGLRTDVQV
jgi:hypothetical protein